MSTAAYQYELFEKTQSEKEQEEFLSILHHDAMKRGGYFARWDIRDKGESKSEVRPNWSAKNAYSLMTTDASYNRYIALNSFHRIKEIVPNADLPEYTEVVNTLKKDREHLHAITTVYMDLDWHEGSMAEIQERVRNTKELLTETYESGALPRPTMTSETGRGLGLFWVLDRSIANTDKTQKQVKFWEYICDEYAKKLESILAEHEKPQLEIDFKPVGDSARIVRMPGTTNLKTASICRLINVTRTEEGNPVYYALGELAEYIENYNIYEKPYSEIKKQIAKKQIVDFQAYTQPYLVARLEKLQRAQKLVINKKESVRELLCFLFFNTCTQLMSKEDAVKKLVEFNNQFKYKLTDQGELQNIVNSVEKVGYYKYTDAKIRKLLKLTDEQNEYVGFGSSLKSLARKQRKEANQKAKKERNERIVAYVIEHPESTYEEIAGLFAVSVRTLKGILKNEGVSRYQKEVTETPVCAAPETAEEDSENDIINIENYKSTQKMRDNSARSTKVQKNAPVSNYVVLAQYNNIYISQTTTFNSIKNKGSVYTDKELKRIRSIDLLEDGWELCDCSAIFDD